MHRILRFKPHLRVELAGDGMVFLVGEHERFLLKGRVHEHVTPLVDGRRTEWEIIEALGGKISPPEAYYTLKTLEEKGYLTEVSADVPVEIAAFWHTLGVDGVRAAERLAATPVAVTAVGDEEPEPVVEALVGAGVTVREDAALRVVLAGDYLDSAIEGLNRRALAEGGRWMLVKSAGATAWLGPMFGREGGPCWACLAQRIAANRPVETYVRRRTGRGGPVTPPRAGLPTGARAALDMAALALARWIVEGGRGEMDEKLLAIDVARFRIDAHAVVRRPQCPACGDPELLVKRAQEPVVLEARPKRFTDDGGYRCMTPEETFARHEHLISPITGVITSVGPVPGRDHPLRPVYFAAYLNTVPPEQPANLDDFTRWGLGKGRTAAQSRTGALCEAIERYSVVFRGDEPRIRARWSDLAQEAVHPRELLQFSDTQYQRREEINLRLRDPRRAVPLRFDENVSIDWTPVFSLTTGARRYVPTSYCYMDTPVESGGQFCSLNPNGHAAGNCLEEAVLQAFFELAERDAVGIWWYNRVRRPAVDLASFGQPYFSDLLAHYRDMGFELWVLDVTNDLEIPAFVALAHHAGADRWYIGFGCHAEARLGVQRALTELNQIFEPAGTARAPWGEEPLSDESFLYPDDSQPRRRRGDHPEFRRDDLRDDVRACVERAARLGLEMLVLDQTRPDIGLTVVKVIVPGLRHFWPRFGPGRLYDVPVRMGWIEQPLEEARLTPVPLYL
ncbi:TOMM precursor leader peptide-binding protein [Sorangium sp. So ce134]